MPPFTAGALGCAALLGLGNGAVFKLVPEYFPGQTGTVTGLVGAMGGLGGFFPPLLLGVFRERVGAIWPGFALLGAYAAYSQKCTHLSCAVYYDRAENHLHCPCHNASFSIADGSVIQGPPQRPLPRVVLERRGDALVALRMEVRA